MIAIRGLNKSYGKYQVLFDIDMQVERGTIHGIIGENGSGKTTLIKCITGIFKPDSGAVLVDGEPVYENSAVKAKMGYVADHTQYFPMYTVKKMKEFFQAMYPSFQETRYEELRKRFGLPENKRVGSLSKGQAMRLSLVLNLAIEPELLILDEPTSGLDAIAKKETMELLIEAVEERGMTVFISSHHLEDLEKLCDTITMIHEGRVQYQADVDTVKSQVAKLQVIWKQGAPEDLEQWAELLHIQRVGNVYQLITREKDAAMEKIRRTGADLVEEIPVSLEEMFIYANRQREE